MNRRPLTAAACCWIVGSGMACLYEGSALWLLWAGVSMFCPLLVVIGYGSWKRILILWLIFSLGAAYWIYNDGRNVSHIPEALNADRSVPMVDGAAVQAEGTIISAVEIDGDRVSFDMSLSMIGLVNSSGSGSKSHAEERAVAEERVTVQLRLSTIEELKIAEKWQRGESIKRASN